MVFKTFEEWKAFYNLEESEDGGLEFGNNLAKECIDILKKELEVSDG